MISSYFIKSKLILEFLLVYFVYIFLIFIPINFTSKLGGLIFRFFGPFTKTNKIVKKNFLQIFPKANNLDIKNQTKQSWINTGKIFFELLILPKIINKKNKITIQGNENLEKIILNKEKVIFIGIHQSNWEILLPSIDKMGIPVTGIYRHINNPYINKLILRIRKSSTISTKSFYTPKGKKSAKDIIQSIKKNISIVLLIDQKDSAGEIVNFFNYPSKTQIGFVKISKKYNMKIIPVENIRNTDNSFTLKFHQPIRHLESNESDIEIMLKIHLIIEKWIKKNPSGWFLQHNRFS